MRRLNKGTDELIRKTEIELQMKKTKLRLLRVRGVGINWDTGMDTHTYYYI